jgi:hypothetical protein
MWLHIVAEVTIRLIPARYWIDFPYETESISIRHGGTTIRTFPPPEISKKKKKKKIIDIVGLIFLFVTIELTPL